MDTTDGAHRRSQIEEILKDSKINEDQKDALMRNAVDVKIVFEDSRDDSHQDFADCGRAKNRPGVLARVASLFARRGFNIYSLAVAPAEHEGMSRITIVVDVESSPLEQITKQLFKLIEVVKISELDPRHSVERELLLATVRVAPEERSQVIEIATIFGAKVLAVALDALTVSLDGNPDKLDDFEDLLSAYGIVELQRTGRVALPKLANPPTDRQARLRAVKGKTG